MTIAKKIAGFQEKSSWIRKMFEEGTRLKAKYGAENVFDFSLGNPNLPPPSKFKSILLKLANDVNLDHAYMANTGYPFVRQSVADYVTREQGVSVSANEIIMTTGAGGALNVILKTILDPGDEVLTPTPCFVEYGFYADNHGGVLKTAPSNPDFELDVEALARAITPKTKALIINSPNNPTGRIYSEATLKSLAAMLEEKNKETGKTIYLISDEPYRKIAYDGAEVPSIFDVYKESVIATSYSKDISIPGERIGYLAVNPAATYHTDLIGGMTLANRILGFVNAPALMQRIICELQGEVVDISEYKRKRDLLCGGLSSFGYEFTKPQGAFYLFPKSPTEDDVAFASALAEERVLVVPGSGFFGPGHFRISYCVDDKTIENAMPGFEKAIKKFR